MLELVEGEVDGETEVEGDWDWEIEGEMLGEIEGDVEELMLGLNEPEMV